MIPIDRSESKFCFFKKVICVVRIRFFSESYILYLHQMSLRRRDFRSHFACFFVRMRSSNLILKGSIRLKTTS
ncbi:hypothetical protein EFP84_04005 [Leptospira kmetyi]|uniref:Uncharacterized protein n=1 Tax=Leptospira kmetyi TaxID=408139 RepID=A0AAD0URB7_9LEPT|nr:hypothetical protein EFP84_04005 [Leptospira kmetyi]EQA51921.1 hypothetical protein LEP1GSC052_0762 [Leptospira kmetyi serovar Malaysia str. Bejo-Iso9]